MYETKRSNQRWSCTALVYEREREREREWVYVRSNQLTVRNFARASSFIVLKWVIVPSSSLKPPNPFRVQPNRHQRASLSLSL
jgi:hypothetical protein